MIGMALNLHIWRNAKVGRMNLVIVVFIAVISVVVADELNQGVFALSCIRSLMRILATISIAFVVWHFIPSVKWPRFAVGNAFPLFVLHGMILYLLSLPFKAFGVWRQLVDMLGPMPIAICTICLALATSVTIRRLFPRFSGVIFGGR